MEENINVISLGAGVQSSTMALMAAKGLISPMPSCAIFSDTQAEPKSVYVWLDWLEKQLPFPVYRVTKGSLPEYALKERKTKDGRTFFNWSIPAFVDNRREHSVCSDCFSVWDNASESCADCGSTEKRVVAFSTKGIIGRKCTPDFKVIPLQKKVKELLSDGQKAVVWIGISLDEAHRMKDSRYKHLIHSYPLVDNKISRHDCLRWMSANGYPEPPRSACTFCPFHSDAEWRRLKTKEPQAFADAVAFEKAMHAASEKDEILLSKPYLHASLKPIGEIDFSSEEEKGQISMFGNECEGLCGV